MKLIALGDNVIDYYHNTQECFPGGNAVNVAAVSYTHLTLPTILRV